MRRRIRRTTCSRTPRSRSEAPASLGSAAFRCRGELAPSHPARQLLRGKRAHLSRRKALLVLPRMSRRWLEILPSGSFCTPALQAVGGTLFTCQCPSDNWDVQSREGEVYWEGIEEFGGGRTALKAALRQSHLA